MEPNPAVAHVIRRARLVGWLLVFFQLGIFAFGAALIAGSDAIVRLAGPDTVSPNLFVGAGWSLVSMGLVFGGVVLVGMALKPSPKAYFWTMSNILAGCLTVILLPLALPLMKRWVQPEVRAHFGVE
jgi:hypothetical protein